MDIQLNETKQIKDFEFEYKKNIHFLVTLKFE